ncbi:MAG: nitroreductase family protein [Spirochaetales bacterium]|nr:nitroreductase family protein [Spirochaetales bacterium]
MEFRDLIFTRQSHRSYDKNKPVAREVLKRICEAGIAAPSAANRQPWEVWVVSSPAKLEQMKDVYRRDWFHQAPHVLLVVGDRKACWTRDADQYQSLETDAAIAMDHMILAAENEGVSTCWIAAFDEAELRKVLGLETNQEVFAITPLGYPKGSDETRPKQRKAFDDVVRWID